MFRAKSTRHILALPLLLSLANVAATADDDLFDVIKIPMSDRSVAAELADLDGDGRNDLLVVSLEGIPPAEKRLIHVFLQAADGTVPKQASYQIPVPQWSAVYDMADLKDTPGVEMVVLRPDGVTVLSLAGPNAPSWDLSVPGPSTVGAADDERGFEPFPLVYDDFADEPWILVPQIGRLSAITADGTVRAALNVSRRANYFVIPEAGLLSVETDIQLFLDVPKLGVGDVNADGRTDILTSTRHEIRVFLQNEEGGFSAAPDRLLPLNLVTARDHIRGSGGVSTLVKDIDGDGALDLMLSHVEGSVTDSNTTTSIFMNRGGQWDLDNPDTRFSEESSLSSDILVDLDGDNQAELLRLRLEFGLWAVVELLMTQEIDASVYIHRFKKNGKFSTKPWSKREISIAFSFDTFRSKGFIPPIGIDLNQDGYVDLMRSGDGDVFDVYLGGDKKPYASRDARQKMVTAGVVHFTDFNGDDLPDFVLFDPHSFDTPVRIAINRGQLEGTPPRLTQRD